MFGHRYYGSRFFGPRYWGEGGAAVAPPAPVGQGGGWRGTEEDVERVERLLRQRGRVRVRLAPAKVRAYGTVRNPVPAEVPVQPEAVPPPPPPDPRVGNVVVQLEGVMASAQGVVGLAPWDEGFVVAVALDDSGWRWIFE